MLPGHALDPRTLAFLTPSLRDGYEERRARIDANPAAPAKLHFAHELALERAFVGAGGLLLAGPDPTGAGGVLPGFGDQREVELLVEAGFTPVEAISTSRPRTAPRILDRLDRIGTLEPGKIADLLVVRGDPGARIADIENPPKSCSRRGVGYDAPALAEERAGEEVGRF